MKPMNTDSQLGASVVLPLGKGKWLRQAKKSFSNQPSVAATRAKATSIARRENCHRRCRSQTRAGGRAKASAKATHRSLAVSYP